MGCKRRPRIGTRVKMVGDIREYKEIRREEKRMGKGLCTLGSPVAIAGNRIKSNEE
jgi:hypothetical protein